MTTLVEFIVAARAHTATAFAGTDWTFHPTPPDACSPPALWPELITGRRNRANGSAMHTAQLRIVAVLDQLENAQTTDRLLEAVDILIAAWQRPPRPFIVDWSWSLAVVEVGGVDHTGVQFDLLTDYPSPC